MILLLISMLFWNLNCSCINFIINKENILGAGCEFYYDLVRCMNMCVYRSNVYIYI